MTVKLCAVTAIGLCLVIIAIWQWPQSNTVRDPEPIAPEVLELVLSDVTPVANDTADIRIAGAARSDKSGKVTWQVPGAALFRIVDAAIQPADYKSDVYGEICTYREGKPVKMGSGPVTCEWTESGLSASCQISVAAVFETGSKLGLILHGIDQETGKYVKFSEYTFPGKLVPVK